MQCRVWLVVAVAIFSQIDDSRGQSRFDEADRRVDELFKEPLYGGAPDAWLMKFTVLGTWDKVAVFYGFVNNLGFCREMVEAHKIQFPEAVYRCDTSNVAPPSED
ncbi:MAG: hypothetical protein KL863_14440 [Rhizobium sp.]|nr:hypothetical protein [Rhizobium sp.]